MGAAASVDGNASGGPGPATSEAAGPKALALQTSSGELGGEGGEASAAGCMADSGFTAVEGGCRAAEPSKEGAGCDAEAEAGPAMDIAMVCEGPAAGAGWGVSLRLAPAELAGPTMNLSLSLVLKAGTLTPCMVMSPWEMSK